MLKRIKCYHCGTFFYGDEDDKEMRCSNCNKIIYDEIKENEIEEALKEECALNPQNPKVSRSVENVNENEKTIDVIRLRSDKSVIITYDKTFQRIEVSAERHHGYIINLVIESTKRKELLNVYFKPEDLDEIDSCFIEPFTNLKERHVFHTKFRVSKKMQQNGICDVDQFGLWMSSSDLVIDCTQVEKSDENNDAMDYRKTQLAAVKELFIGGMVSFFLITAIFFGGRAIGRSIFSNLKPDTVGVDVEFRKVQSDQSGIPYQLREVSAPKGFQYSAGGEYVITSVHDSSPAQRANIQPGDIIISIDGRLILSENDLRKILAEHKKGQPFEYIINRNNENVNISVKFE